MIEFKAECGHTVRAKDQDGGKVVRCSYCGKAANVPETVASGGGGGMDFLLSEINDAQDSAAAATVIPRRKRSWFKRKPRREGEFDPFAFTLKLVYAAALVTVVFLVGKMFVMPLIQGTAPRPSDPGPYEQVQLGTGGATTRRPAAPAAGGPQRTAGLRTLSDEGGLYISATPASAEVYFLPQDSAPKFGQRFADRKGCSVAYAGARMSDLEDGPYVVEVVYKWTDGTLNNYPGFREFREAIRDADGAKREQLMQEYFLPDESSAAFVDQTEDQTYLVRQYAVDVRGGRWASVRSVFLPRIEATSGAGFSIGPVVRYLPDERPYEFDDALVRRELDFYRVPANDRQYIVDMLRALGVAPYTTAEGRTQMFKIAVDDGTFGVKDITQRGG
jgi:hypothetical protein